jgi:predicted HTH transcriptional regulator
LLVDGDFFEAFVPVPNVASPHAASSTAIGGLPAIEEGSAANEGASVTDESADATTFPEVRESSGKSGSLSEYMRYADAALSGYVDKTALFLVEKKGAISSSELAEAAGVDARTARRHLSALVSAGVLRQERSGRAVRYLLNRRDAC